MPAGITLSTEYRSEEGIIAGSTNGTPEGLSNFGTTTTGTASFSTTGERVTVGPLRDNPPDGSGTNYPLSQYIPSDGVVTGIEVQIGVVHSVNGNFTNNSSVVSRFQLKRATSYANATSNTFAESGTQQLRNGSQGLGDYVGPVFGIDPTNFNTTFGGPTNMLGLTSGLEPSAYDNMGLRIEFFTAPTNDFVLKVASRNHDHANGPSPAVRLYYTTNTNNSIRVTDFSKISITGDSKVEIR